MSKVRVFDIEANGLLHVATKVHCAVVSDLKQKGVKQYRPHQIKDFIKELNTCDVIICHNVLGYDLPLLEKLYNFKFKGKVIDTLILSRLQKPERPMPPHAKDKKKAAKVHSLYAWGVRVGVDKPDYEEWEEFDEEMLHRCTEDVKINVLTFFKLMEEAKGQDWKRASDLTHTLFANLRKQEEYGWKVDVDYMHKSVKLLTRWIDLIDKTLAPYIPLKVEVNETKVKGEYKFVQKPFKKDRTYTKQVLDWMDSCGLHPSDKNVVGPFTRISFRSVSLDSNDETKEFLLKEGWKPETWNYKSDPKTKKPIKDERGQLIKTSPKLSGDDAFVGIEGKVGKMIAKRVQCRHRRSNIEGWLKIVRPDGRIGARVTGMANTGRMKHASVVNVPGGDSFFGKQMRKCFTSKEGFVIVGTDAASCQDRCLAARANDPALTRMLLEGNKEEGTDGHSIAMHAINKKIVPAGLKPINRGTGKGINYGAKFGAGDAKLGLMVGGTSAHGALVKEALAEAFPAQAGVINSLVEEWRSHAQRRVNDWGKLEYYNGWFTGLDGRPVYAKSEHQILVFCLQSDEAILMAAAYNLLFKRLSKKYKWGVDWGIVAWVHDEIQVECREEIAEDVARLSEKSIVDASRFYNMKVLQKGEAAIGKNWFETH